MNTDNPSMCLALIAATFVLITVVNILFDKRFNRDFDFMTSVRCNIKLSLKVMLLTSLLVLLSTSVFAIVYLSIEHLIK
ncbi:Uncharacterised protein [Enterobacter hormaechei]|nr:Uncharacterised protein [Enterobacter hormaechei]